MLRRSITARNGYSGLLAFINFGDGFHRLESASRSARRDPELSVKRPFLVARKQPLSACPVTAPTALVAPGTEAERAQAMVVGAVVLYRCDSQFRQPLVGEFDHP